MKWLHCIFGKIMTIKNEINIFQPASTEDFDAVKALFREHEKELSEEICFKNFDVEMKNIQTIYSLPDGALLLAAHRGQAVGVVGMVGVGNGVAEMKRLYVRPEWRNKGIGGILCEKIMAAAKGASYTSMRLETFLRLEGAIALYLNNGFKMHEKPANGDNGICAMVSSL